MSRPDDRPADYWEVWRAQQEQRKSAASAYADEFRLQGAKLAGLTPEDFKRHEQEQAEERALRAALAPRAAPAWNENQMRRALGMQAKPATASRSRSKKVR